MRPCALQLYNFNKIQNTVALALASTASATVALVLPRATALLKCPYLHILHRPMQCRIRRDFRFQISEPTALSTVGRVHGAGCRVHGAVEAEFVDSMFAFEKLYYVPLRTQKVSGVRGGVRTDARCTRYSSVLVLL